VQVTHDAPLKIAQEASSKDASTHQVSTFGLTGDQKKIPISACHWRCKVGWHNVGGPWRWM